MALFSRLKTKPNTYIWAKKVATKRDKKTGRFGWPIGLDLENPYIETSRGEGGIKLSCYTWNGRSNERTKVPVTLLLVALNVPAEEHGGTTAKDVDPGSLFLEHCFAPPCEALLCLRKGVYSLGHFISNTIEVILLLFIG